MRSIPLLCVGLLTGACGVEPSGTSACSALNCSTSSNVSGDDTSQTDPTTTPTTQSPDLSTASSNDSGGSTDLPDLGPSDTSMSSVDDEGHTSFETSGGLPPSLCGNGIIENEETCDDGNDIPGDGCQECAKDSIVFVSSELYQGFALEGLHGADQRCRSLAGLAGLQRHLTYKAWLSTPTMSASDRLVHSRGRYLLVNGLVVAQNWEGLVSGTLENPIMVDDSSLSRDDGVWTGTLASGEPSFGDEFCEDWDDDSGLLKFAGVGISTSTDATWSFIEPVSCDAELRLYCIEQ